jgi:phage-related protein
MADEAKPKPVVWIGTSRKDLRTFPEDVKDEVGAALTAVQYGRSHPSLKTLSGFGSAAIREVKANDPSGTYRVVYSVEFPEVVYVLHSFQKKSKSGKGTPKEEMDRVHARLAEAELHHAENYG